MAEATPLPGGYGYRPKAVPLDEPLNKPKTDWLTISSTILGGLDRYSQGQGVGASKDFSALQHRLNARRRLQAGQREATTYRKAGRKVVSDATVAMAAQGGTVDSAMLAKMKREAEIDAISALYDAKTEAITLESQARLDKIEGRSARRAGRYGLASSILSATSTYASGLPQS